MLCCTFAKRTGIGGISAQLANKFGYEVDYSYDDLLNIPIRNILLELQELAFNKKINRLFYSTVNSVMDKESGRFRDYESVKGNMET